MSGASDAAATIALSAVLGLADDVESLLHEERRKRVAREWVVVDDEHALGHVTLIGS